MANLLVVDDEPRVVSFLTRFLIAEGHSVTCARDGLMALERLSERGGRPGPPRPGDAAPATACRCWPRSPHGVHTLLRCIVLSAVNEVAARVQALDRGAVDFVQKPFHSAELVARIRRHLAAAPPQPTTDRGRYLLAGGVELDLDQRRARGKGFDVVLTEREFGLLAHLMRRHGDVCGKDELLHDVWGLAFDPGSNVVEVCMRRLRTKLGEPPIETDPRRRLLLLRGLRVGNRSGSRLYVPWLMLAAACTALMWFVPGEETIPYHVAFIGLALAYGIEPWPWVRTLSSMFAYTVLTGAILLTRAVDGRDRVGRDRGDPVDGDARADRGLQRAQASCARLTAGSPGSPGATGCGPNAGSGSAG